MRKLTDEEKGTADQMALSVEAVPEDGLPKLYLMKRDSPEGRVYGAMVAFWENGHDFQTEAEQTDLWAACMTHFNVTTEDQEAVLADPEKQAAILYYLAPFIAPDEMPIPQAGQVPTVTEGPVEVTPETMKAALEGIREAVRSWPEEAQADVAERVEMHISGNLDVEDPKNAPLVEALARAGRAALKLYPSAGDPTPHALEADRSETPLDVMVDEEGCPACGRGRSLAYGSVFCVHCDGEAYVRHIAKMQGWDADEMAQHGLTDPNGMDPGELSDFLSDPETWVAGMAETSGIGRLDRWVAAGTEAADREEYNRLMNWGWGQAAKDWATRSAIPWISHFRGQSGLGSSYQDKLENRARLAPWDKDNGPAYVPYAPDRYLTRRAYAESMLEEAMAAFVLLGIGPMEILDTAQTAFRRVFYDVARGRYPWPQTDLYAVIPGDTGEALLYDPKGYPCQVKDGQIVPARTEEEGFINPPKVDPDGDDFATPEIEAMREAERLKRKQDAADRYGPRDPVTGVPLEGWPDDAGEWTEGLDQ